MIFINVSGIPKPKGSLRHVGGGRMVEQVAGSVEWKERVRWAAVAAMRGQPKLEGPVLVRASLSLERPRSHSADSRPVTRSSGDVDKHARNLLDGLTGIVFHDDSQVTALDITKAYDVTAGALIWVYPR